MSSLTALIKRNIKLFFKDKGMFITSLITPIILLVLYVTFLGKIYRDSFATALPKGFTVPDQLIAGTVGGELFSSLLAVCCITVAFCSNLLAVQDKVTGARRDLLMTPVSRPVLGISYYIATFIVTLIICFAATGACFFYLWKVGWYLSADDVLMLILDVMILVLFGTALSSIINYFLSTQGQISAVGSIVSAGYGFICGAYMPISSFGEGMQKALSFLPGTYGTALIRNHAMRGAFDEMADRGIPKEVIEGIKDGVDCNLYFSGDKVSMTAMFVIVAGSAVVLMAVYVLINILGSRKAQVK